MWANFISCLWQISVIKETVYVDNLNKNVGEFYFMFVYVCESFFISYTVFPIYEAGMCRH